MRFLTRRGLVHHTILLRALIHGLKPFRLWLCIRLVNRFKGRKSHDAVPLSIQNGVGSGKIIVSSKNLDPTRFGLAQNTAEPHYFYADSAVGKIYARLRPYCKTCQNVRKRTDTINCVTSNLRRFSMVK
jgi:hypothetical protein